jgi:hypothetical protein
MASIDGPRPSSFTTEHLAEDLSLSNAEASSWFGYEYNAGLDALEVDLYAVEGEVIRTFIVTIEIKEVEL